MKKQQKSIKIVESYIKGSKQDTRIKKSARYDSLNEKLEEAIHIRASYQAEVREISKAIKSGTYMIERTGSKDGKTIVKSRDLKAFSGKVYIRFILAQLNRWTRKVDSLRSKINNV